MRSTYHRLYYHAIFSTKHRQPVIDATWRPLLHEYLGGVVRGLGEKSLIVGGTADHVHLLLSLRTLTAPANLVRELKKASTAWARAYEPAFAWQQGYGIFSASITHLEALRDYIAHQESHHRVVSFEAEFQKLLAKHGLEYEPPYPENGTSTLAP